MNLIARYPARTMAIVIAVTGALATFLPGPVIAAVNGIAAAILGVGVHGAVTPVAAAVENTVLSARAAAVRTAQALTEATAGEPGELTDGASATINGIIADVVNPMTRS